jgi:trigger factor
VKATTETLSPTRVRLTVEVPFDELKPTVDDAYKRLAQQVRVQGFRPGRVPPRIIDQRLGRDYVLNEALPEALSHFYVDAVRDNEVDVLGRPEVDVTEFADGQPLVFTAEVDVRPEVTLPEYQGLEVTVDDVEVTDEDLTTQLDGLRDRFASLTPVEREVATGDFVSIDLSATVDGEPVPGAEATGMSYEVGSGTMIEGLDDVLVGASVDDERTFPTELVAGDFAGRTADVTVTVRGVKVKELPELDDEFAEKASEFDTLAELTENTRTRLESSKRTEQGIAARDKVLELLVERSELELPSGAVAAEVEARENALDAQLEQWGLTKDAYLRHQKETSEEHDAHVRTEAEQAVRAQFVLDAVAKAEQVGVDQQEVIEQIFLRAQRMGIAPDQYARMLEDSGQTLLLLTEVRRAKALALVLQSAKITDASGREVDLSALSDPNALLDDDFDEDDDDFDDLAEGAGPEEDAEDAVDADAPPVETAEKTAAATPQDEAGPGAGEAPAAQ